MAERPIFHAGLGGYFVSLRQRLGWGQRQAAEIAERRGVNDITRQVLLRLEKGMTKNPEPGVLRAVSDLYGVTYEELVIRCVEAQYGLDMRPAKPGEPKPEAKPAAPALDPKEEALVGLLRAIPDKGKRQDLMRFIATAAAGLLAEPAVAARTLPARVLPIRRKKTRKHQ